MKIASFCVTPNYPTGVMERGAREAMQRDSRKKRVKQKSKDYCSAVGGNGMGGREKIALVLKEKGVRFPKRLMQPRGECAKSSEGVTERSERM